MTTTCITYRKVLYKYRLLQDKHHSTALRPSEDIGVPGDWVRLSASGQLSIRAGYHWDGPSGPTIDTPSFMRGSLVHDGLYQLLREGLLGERASQLWSHNRKLADLELVRICREDGMFWLRRAWVYRSLRWAGAAAAQPDDPVKIQSAPKHCVPQGP